jgi:hypothetical protein
LFSVFYLAICANLPGPGARYTPEAYP